MVGFDVGLKCAFTPDACTTATAACIDCSSAAAGDSSCVDDAGANIDGCVMRDSFAEAALADEDASTYLDASCLLKASEQAECEALDWSCSDDTSQDQQTCEAVSDCPDGDGGTTGSACVWGSQPSPCEFVADACVPTAASLAEVNIIWQLAHSSAADCPAAGCKCSAETTAAILGVAAKTG